MRIPLTSISVVWMRSSGALVAEEPVLIREGGQFDAQFQLFIRSPLNRSKSTAWMRIAARAVSLLAEAHNGADPQHASDYEVDRLAAYLDAGRTCLSAAEGVLLEVYQPAYRKRLLAIASEYIAFCGGSQLQRSQISMTRDYSMLRHLGTANELFRVARSTASPIVFPHSKLDAFFAAIREGAASPAHAVRDQLLFLILAYGGVRSSEPLHLWVDDVRIEGEGPVVYFYHPSYGPVATGPNPRATRMATLRQRYDLTPRHLLGTSNSQRAGWKGMMLEERIQHGERARVYWLDPAVANTFCQLHLQYVTHIRPLFGARHPYYFTSLSGEAPGRPCTLRSLRDTFARAAQSSELKPGITPHSFRHAYAQRLTDLGLPASAIQTCLHHRSPASQRVYGRPGPEEISSLIASAMRAPAEARTLQRDAPWRSDPLQLFPGMDSTWKMLR